VTQDLSKHAQERLRDWHLRARQWYAAYYIFGVLATVLTITVASRPHFIAENNNWYHTLAWLAALFQGLGTFLVALPKATAYRSAWRSLWLAHLNYLDSQGDKETTLALKQAITKGWEIIDGGYTDAFKHDSGAAGADQ
jgi:hypothetical protein